nr:hypothetical protein CTI12_AA179160 [Tanacetum cinerariifolium]
MGEPLSSDRVFDFPMDEPQPHLAYGFFPIAEGEEQATASMIDVDEDIAMLFGDDDFSDEDSKEFEDAEEVWKVMDAPTIPVSAEENLGDPIDIKVDIIHLEPVATVDFLAAAVVRTQAQHGEAIRGMIKTTEAIEKITHNRERQVRNKMEQQLAAVQESQQQDRENFRKLQELLIKESPHTELVPPGNLIKPGSDLTDVTVIAMRVIMMKIRVCGDMLPYGKLAVDDYVNGRVEQGGTNSVCGDSSVNAGSCPVKCFRASPVCGVDNVTYWCGCSEAICAGVDVAKAGFCETGNGGSGAALLLVHIVWLVLLGFFVLFGLL